MKKIFLIISIMFLACLIVHSQEGWQQLTSASLLNLDGVVGLGHNSYSFMLKNYNKGQYEPVDGRYISYVLARYELDCNSLTYRINTLDSYDKENNYVTTDKNNGAEFQPIVKGTAVDLVSQLVCVGY